MRLLNEIMSWAPEVGFLVFVINDFCVMPEAFWGLHGRRLVQNFFEIMNWAPEIGFLDFRTKSM